MRFKLFSLATLLFSSFILLTSHTTINSSDDDREEMAEFLVDMAQHRMLTFEQSKLAYERGTTTAIRNFGALMIKEQALLLHKLSLVAAKADVILPTELNEDQKEELQEFKEEYGKEFDEKYVSEIEECFENDVECFNKAKSYKNTTVKQFATNNLPIIKTHLEKIESIDMHNE